MKKAIFGVVDKDLVQPLVTQLKQSGFTDLEISILMPEVVTPKDADLLPDASKGAIAGGVIGVIASEFALLTTLMIPGVGPFLVAGPIVTALAGGTVGGVIGGLSGATGWVSKILGMPGKAVDQYEEDLKSGRRGLVMVECETPEHRHRAMEAFRKLNVTDIQEGDPGPMSPPNVAPGDRSSAA